MTAPYADDHRTRISDATIVLLAREGFAGVTHRALDRILELPEGTTRNLFPTRLDIAQAAGERLALLDGLEASDFRASAAGIAAVVDRAISSDRRDRLLARFELYLLSARTPEFMTMHWAREMFAAGTEAHLRVASVRSPELSAVGVIALIEGLLLHGLLAPLPSRKDRATLIRRMFSGLCDRLRPEGTDRL
jgi:DNA-binding transcriptional regulator YbjK